MLQWFAKRFPQAFCNSLKLNVLKWNLACFNSPPLGGTNMQRALGMMLVVAGLSSVAFGTGIYAPEIDGMSAVSALTLLSGAVLVIRSRRK